MKTILAFKDSLATQRPSSEALDALWAALAPFSDAQRRVITTSLAIEAVASPVAGQYSHCRQAGIVASGENGIPVLQSMLDATHPAQASALADHLVDFAQTTPHLASLEGCADRVDGLFPSLLSGDAQMATRALITHHEIAHD